MPAEIDNKYACKYDDIEIEKLCSDLLDWAENAKDIHICGWTRKQKKTKSWLNWLSDHYPKFKEAKDEAMRLLGRKLLNASFYGSGNATVGMGYLPVYDEEFRELLKWKAEISKDITYREQNRCIFNNELKKIKESI